MRKVWDTNELVCLSNINSHVDWTQKKKEPRFSKDVICIGYP